MDSRRGAFAGALGRVSIGARVALFATALTLGSLCVLGYAQLSSLSAELTRAAQEQGVTDTTQVARAFAGLSPSVVSVVPSNSRGLDGVVMFDGNGRVLAGSGGTQATLRGLAADARSVVRSRRMSLQFRVPESGSRSRRVGGLAPWSSSRTLQITILPREGGAIAVSRHVGWATERLRSSAFSSTLNLGGGAAFLCFALMLMLGRLVTRPLGRLAAEVRHLGEGNLGATLSVQHSPELRQLAADTSQMRDDLLRAVRDSTTDPLTGVANHRGFHERLDAAVETVQREGTSVAVIAIDLDNLKMLNDRFGHQAGDRIIQAVAATIAGACRPDDLCGRVGGDEFAVICPGADRTTGETVAERIATAVRTIPIAELAGPAARRSGLTASVSTGVCDLPGTARTKDELVVTADAALYAAKGRQPARHRGEPTSATDEPRPPAEALAQSVRGIAVAIDARDGATSSHSEAVARYAVAIGERMGLHSLELASLQRAAVVHDAGKIGVPDAVLLKPGPLTPAEREIMEQHSALSYRIALAAGLPEREALWVLHHHEHLDGSGYPHRLRGEEIPLASRILLVADAFDAMTVARPYRPARSANAALAELRRCAGTQFDASAIEALAHALTKAAELAPTLAEQVPDVPGWRLSEQVS
jgi:diguanylate cyclase (GGDEF)-like protein